MRKLEKHQHVRDVLIRQYVHQHPRALTQVGNSSQWAAAAVTQYACFGCMEQL